MTEEIAQPYPKAYRSIEKATRQADFAMASDVHACALLKTLAATKPGGKFLELGTGTGLSTAWVLDGMDEAAGLVSVDNDPAVLRVAEQFLGHDARLQLVCADGGDWIEQNSGSRFDFVFADSWHGKYLMLEKVLRMLNPGGLYIIDDMLPQENWPAGHHEKAANLVAVLEARPDLFLTKLRWSTGIIIAVKNGVASPGGNGG